MTQPARRFSLFVLTLLLAGALLGGLLGGRVQANPHQPDDQLWTFGRVMALVEDHFVREADPEKLVEDAIDGLLRTLDPHSNYLDADSFSEMRDEQRGKFSGLGIQITKRGPDKPLTIIAPIDDTPAFRAGLQSGDVISKINGEPTIDLTVNEAVHRLKGRKGTQVTISIERLGDSLPFDVTIERDDIPIESIRVAHMLQPGVGYIRISNFTSTTAEELDQTIEKLTQKGMIRLLLDLRGNPGGLLEQAVQVSERFIPAGELIVYTRGRIHGSNQDYVAKRGVERWEQPLILLVDGSSASASEIVSGAVQDHDRGLIVGETTFGKGLVQRVIPLRQGGGALAVTTAKYYTPKGRLIQRDYTDIEEYYLRRDDPSPEEEASSDDTEGREVFYTTAGRKVYGGGGIRPDHIVKSTRAPKILYRLLRENLIFDFVVRQTSSKKDIEPGFEIDETTMAGFRDFLHKREFEFEEETFAEHQETLALRLRAQIARLDGGQEAESQVLTGADPQVQRALELFDEAAELSRQGTQTPVDDLHAEAAPEVL